jgi:hypothetical protein
MKHIEDAGHRGYDMLIYRAFASGRYGITADQLLPFANTVQYVMYQGKGMFPTRVDGNNKTAARNTIAPPGCISAGSCPPLILSSRMLTSSKSKPAPSPPP